MTTDTVLRKQFKDLLKQMHLICDSTVEKKEQKCKTCHFIVKYENKQLGLWPVNGFKSVLNIQACLFFFSKYTSNPFSSMQKQSWLYS